jgi:hypothetical protein
MKYWQQSSPMDEIFSNLLFASSLTLDEVFFQFAPPCLSPQTGGGGTTDYS